MTRPNFNSLGSPLLLLGAALLATGSLNAQPTTPAPAPAPAAADAPNTAPVNNQPVFVVPAGTKIPLTLRSAISTQTARPGDTVYLNSEFPVIVGSRVPSETPAPSATSFT